MRNLFNEPRTAEAAAFLLHRAGGALPLIKLLKLLYLSERLSFQRYGEPLTGDRLVSMDHGPVLSRTYNLINGAARSADGGWETWISDREGHRVALRDPSMIRSPEQDLSSLSDSDLEVLGDVWEQFGHWKKWDLVDYTHDHCPEWEDPAGSSKGISYERLFSALGFSEDAAAELLERLRVQEAIEASFE
jgi:uncharacterized phage-associated protein